MFMLFGAIFACSFHVDIICFLMVIRNPGAFGSADFDSADFQFNSNCRTARKFI
jgi:hypothetical protein